MAVVNITNQNYQEEVLKADKTVLMDFWTAGVAHARCFYRLWMLWQRREKI